MKGFHGPAIGHARYKTIKISLKKVMRFIDTKLKYN